MNMGMSTRPDWVILGGGQTDGGVMVLASTQLAHAELEMVYDKHSMFDLMDRLAHLDRRITLTVEMGKFVIIIAPDYPTALRQLFEKWEPKAADRPAVEGRPVLPAGL